jgi:hypothetical protein
LIEAFEVAGTLLTAGLMLLSEGFHRQPFVDLASSRRCGRSSARSRSRAC